MNVHEDNGEATPPSQSPTTTPLPSRAMSQTQSSAARANQLQHARSATTSPAISSLRSRFRSKIPSPHNLASAGKVGGATSSRTSFFDQTRQTPTPAQNPTDGTLKSASGRRRHSRIPSFIRPTLGSDQLPKKRDAAASPSTPQTPLDEKPLPSAPAASVVSGRGPYEDSRGLIDASERPLANPWPALTPRSVSAPERKESPSSFPTESARSSTSRKAVFTPRPWSPTTKTINEICQTYFPRDSKLAAATPSSSPPPFVNAIQSSPNEPPALPPFEFPPRAASGVGADKVTNTPSSRDDSKQFSRQGTAPIFLPCLPSVLDQSRYANASPVSEGIIEPAGAPEDQTNSPGISPKTIPARTQSLDCTSRFQPSGDAQKPPTDKLSRHHRIASRIPISANKKATLIDINTGGTRGQHESSPGISPSHAGRRLLSPNALKNLDEAKKRREVNQGDADPSTARTPSRQLSSLSKSYQTGSSTPEHTIGPSSSEDEEALTPATLPESLLPGDKLARSNTLIKNRQQQAQSPDFWEPAEARLTRAPPSRSPYTGPLETIPSQAVLPVQPDDMPSHATMGTDLADLVQQYSDFGDNPVEGAQQPSVTGSPAHSICLLSERGSSMEFPEGRTFVFEDEFSGPEAEAEAKRMAQRSRTLSHLERQGTPPLMQIDKTVARDFFDDDIQFPTPQQMQQVRGSTLYDKAATAERYLAQESPSEIPPFGQYLSASYNAYKESKAAGKQPVATHEDYTLRMPPCISKWSDSTPSAVGHSTTASGEASSPLLPTAHEQVPHSIGSPLSSSAIPRATPSTRLYTKPSTSRRHRRSDSPTLPGSVKNPKPMPGSIKAARDALRRGKRSYANQTASTETKRNAKIRKSGTLPTPLQRAPQRGRQDGRKESGGRGSPKLPRSRSRGRTVLDRIGGFFSGKRETKAAGVPPVPPIPASVLAASRARTRQMASSSTPQPSLSRVPVPRPAAAKSPPAPLETQRTSPATNTTPATPPPEDPEPSTSEQATNDNASVLFVSEKLREKAQLEEDDQRKERLLHAAQVLNDCMTYSNQANLSAEMARRAANDANTSAEITARGVVLMQRMASALVKSITRENQ